MHFRAIALSLLGAGLWASAPAWAEPLSCGVVLPMAPGHVPENFYPIPEVRRGIDAARQAVTSGQGDALVEMTDINQGQRRAIKAPAAALWSYFDPQGWGNMALSAQSFRKPVPVFWAIGTQDPLDPSRSAAIYQKLPAHSDSQYWVVQANHATTPDVASGALLDWVKARTGR